MVQMGLSHEIINAQPAGQVVPFSTCVKMKLALFRCFWPIGRAIMVAKIRMKFMITNTVCNFPMTRAQVEAMKPWLATVHKKTA